MDAPPLPAELHPFQRDGVKYALQHKRCWIADEMGLGKSVQALVTLEQAHAYPAVIVCPASLKINWSREAARWLPGRSVQVLSGIKAQTPPERDITIINYDILQHWMDKLSPVAVVCDESQYLKNLYRQRTLATAYVTRGRGWVLLLTGTPLLNHTQELIGQLEVMGRLGEFGGEAAFEERYCVKYNIETLDRYGNPLKITKYATGKNIDELRERLLNTCMIRRLKSEVLPELPPKQRVTLWLAPDKKVMREYRQTINAGIDVTAISKLRILTAQAKLPAVKEWIQNMVDAGEQLVVFVHHRCIGEALTSYFKAAAAIRGGMTATSRQAAVDAFQSGKARIVVCSIQAAGVGLTLTVASNVLFVEQAWTPALMEQAEDRIHRISQLRQVTCWYAAIENSYDQIIFRLLRQKAKTIRAITAQDVVRELQNDSSRPKAVA